MTGDIQRRILAGQRLQKAAQAGYQGETRPDEAMLQDLLISMSDFPGLLNSRLEMYLAHAAVMAGVHIRTGRLRWEQTNFENGIRETIG